jgi:predicted PurR-regulated permease PerM
VVIHTERRSSGGPFPSFGLLALVCVFGGILYFEILGVFLGPIIGALLVALLRILKKEVLGVSFADGRTLG